MFGEEIARGTLVSGLAPGREAVYSHHRVRGAVSRGD